LEQTNNLPKLKFSTIHSEYFVEDLHNWAVIALTLPSWSNFNNTDANLRVSISV